MGKLIGVVVFGVLGIVFPPLWIIAALIAAFG